MSKINEVIEDVVEKIKDYPIKEDLESLDQEQHTAKELAKFNLNDAKIAELKSKYLQLVVSGPEDNENYLECKSAHQEVKKLRISIEEKRKELKADAIKFERAVDARAKELTDGVSEVEKHLYDQRKVVEDEQKRIQAKIEADRLAEEARLKKEEEDRIEAIRVENEAKEKALKAERDAFEAEKAEFARKKASDEQKIKDDAKRLVDEENARQAKIEAEKRATEKAEADKKAAEEKRIKDENERIETEKAAKAMAEAIKPDIEKLLSFSESLKHIPIPILESKPAQRVLTLAVSSIEQIAETIIRFVNNSKPKDVTNV